VRYYPVFLDLAGQPVVVLGGGHFAAEKVASLAEAGALVKVITAKPSPAIERLVEEGRVDVFRRDYRQGDLVGARLVVDASEDEAINKQSWQEAEAAGTLINVVDRPERCRFIAPAIVRRDPLLIAVSTSGESPFLASAIRARIERWLGTEWGPFTALVGRVRRELRERGVPLSEQTRTYKRLLASDARRLIRTGDESAARQLAASMSRPAGRQAGRVALVGAGPGDPGLLTVRAQELLADADFVLHDALVSHETLALSGPGAQLEDVGKRGGRASIPQADITARLIELARQGHLVVRLKGGDPFVFGRGGDELLDLVAAGVDVVVVPGVSAAIAAPAAAGIPLTLRGVASSVAITTAQGGDSPARIRQLALAADTLVVLMASSRLEEVTATLSAVLGPRRPAAMISQATLPEQQVVTGTVGEIAGLAARAGLASPATLVVGEVAGWASPSGACAPPSPACGEEMVGLGSFG
jgi:uroporphyrin-III C-methyltransferase/precorrin-2 dehydrogenase/sirohydrochlorin ferrochelatase